MKIAIMDKKMNQKIMIRSVGSKLSLAVNLIDDYSRGEIVGEVKVSLKGETMKPVRNPSGYYLFLNLPESSYTVQVNGGEFYFDAEKENVKLTDLEQRNPVINITLYPTPSYPFTHTATLIMGRVQDSSGRGIPNAVLNVRESDIRAITTGKGDFVIYFKGLKKDDVALIDGKKLVNINGKNPILEIVHSDYGKKTISVEVEERKITSLSVTCP
jgi:hypothetical protein